MESENWADAYHRCPECDAPLVYDTRSPGDVVLLICTNEGCDWRESEAASG